MTHAVSDRQIPPTTYREVMAAMTRALLDSRPKPAVQPTIAVTATSTSTAVFASKTTCALCGWRDASTRESVDGRVVPVCKSCTTIEIAEPPPPPSLRERVLIALGRCDCADMEELSAMIGMTSQLERGAISACLNRAAKKGLIGFLGGRMSRSYYVVKPS